MTKKTLIRTLILILLFIVSLLIIKPVHNDRKPEGDEVYNDYCQYYSGEKYTYRAVSEFYNDGTTTGLISNDGKTEFIDAIPVYNEYQLHMVCTKDMVQVCPNSPACFSKINALTEIEYVNATDGIYKITAMDKSIVNKGFLYDGGGIYIFLEPVSIKVDETYYKLDTLSYLELTNEYLRLFIYGSKECLTNKYNGETITALSNTGYSIDITANKLTWFEGKTVLIFNDPSQLR